jgi:hypothetical protein
LIWEPVFADISSSGDFGYTTGPSEYYPTRKPGEHAFYGSYITMWKKEKGSEWKMALDIGIYLQPKPLSKFLVTPDSTVKTKHGNKKDFRQDLMNQEMLFILKLSGQGRKDYSSFIASQSWFLRAGIEPLTNMIKIAETIRKEIGKVSYTHRLMSALPLPAIGGTCTEK